MKTKSPSYMLLALACIALTSLTSLNAAALQPARTVNPLEAHGGLPIPKTLQDLKNLSLTFWIKFRGTNQRYYLFINEAAKFHAYADLCKRHQLNVSMGPITTVAQRYVTITVPAHYDEPELALLAPLSQAEKEIFTQDMASDVYAFEYGFQLAKILQAITTSRKTKKTFCEINADRYKDRYFGLYATARRALSEN